MVHEYPLPRESWMIVYETIDKFRDDIQFTEHQYSPDCDDSSMVLHDPEYARKIALDWIRDLGFNPKIFSVRVQRWIVADEVEIWTKQRRYSDERPQGGGQDE